MKFIPSLLMLIIATTTPVAARAQDDGPASRGMKATAIAIEAGLSQDGTTNNGWWGGTAFWQPTHRVGIAVSGRWLDAGSAANAFAADISTEIGLVSRASRSVPYVRLGVGAYRATFDVADARQRTTTPDFYRRRFSTDLTTGRETFMDPMVVVAAGMDVPLNRRVSVRPDVRGMWVIRGGHAYQVVLIGMQLAYHIEEHPVTPSRDSR